MTYQSYSFEIEQALTDPFTDTFGNLQLAAYNFPTLRQLVSVQISAFAILDSVLAESQQERQPLDYWQAYYNTKQPELTQLQGLSVQGGNPVTPTLNPTKQQITMNSENSALQFYGSFPTQEFLIGFYWNDASLAAAGVDVKIRFHTYLVTQPALPY